MERYKILREIPSLLKQLGCYSERDELKINETISNLVFLNGQDVSIKIPESPLKLSREQDSSYKAYRAKVQKLTELQPLHLLNNFEKRGLRNWHVDHKIPVFYGWQNDIPPELIAHLGNLQMLHWHDNHKKGQSLKFLKDAKGQ